MPQLKIIRTERALYEWALQYMQQTGPQQLYPKVLVDFAERLFQEIPDYVDNDILLDMVEHASGGAGDSVGVLATLLSKIGADTSQRLYSRQLIEFAAQAITVACHAGLNTAHANRCAIVASGLMGRGYFAVTGTVGQPYLCTTLKGERALGIRVKIEQDEEVLGWFLTATHVHQ